MPAIDHRNLTVPLRVLAGVEYSRNSKKWKTLALDGPYPVNLISFGVETRPASAIGTFSYPGGRRITMAGVKLT
jgi:hypothetical protein